MNDRRCLGVILSLVILGSIAGRSHADLVFGTGTDPVQNYYDVFKYDTATGQTTKFITGLLQPTGIAYNKLDGNLYVSVRSPAGPGLYYIEKYSITGQDLGTVVGGLTSSYRGVGLAFDSAGNLFATEQGKIQEFFAAGGSRFFSAGALPYQMAVTSTGLLLVTNSGSSRISMYDTTIAAPIESTFGTMEGNHTANGIFVDGNGFVFVSDVNGIFEYLPSGILSGTFSSRGGYGLTFDANLNTVFEVDPPNLYAIGPNGAANLVSTGFNSSEYITSVAGTVVPEPKSMVILAIGMVVASVYARSWRVRHASGY